LTSDTSRAQVEFERVFQSSQKPPSNSTEELKRIAQLLNLNSELESVGKAKEFVAAL
jgi:hypothetical protein